MGDVGHEKLKYTRYNMAGYRAGEPCENDNLIVLKRVGKNIGSWKTAWPNCRKGYYFDIKYGGENRIPTGLYFNMKEGKLRPIQNRPRSCRRPVARAARL